MVLDFGLRFLIFFLQHRIAGIHSKDIQYVTEVLKSSACFQPARQIYYYTASIRKHLALAP